MVGQWQHNWLWIYNSSHRSLVKKTVVMTNKLFPPCDGFHFLWIYSCLRRCGPHAYTVAGGLRNCRYTRFHSRVRSHSLFCEYLTNSRVAIYAKTGLCKCFLQSGSNNSRDHVRRKPFTVWQTAESAFYYEVLYISDMQFTYRTTFPLKVAKVSVLVAPWLDLNICFSPGTDLSFSDFCLNCTVKLFLQMAQC